MALSALVALFLSGCPGVTPPPPEPVPTAKEIYITACKAYGVAWCAGRDRCAVMLDRSTEGAACSGAFSSGCDAAVAVAPGRGFDAFDKAAADACTVALATAECDLFTAMIVDLTSCRQGFGSAAHRGENCLLDGDCATGYCGRVEGRCGRCELRAEVGAACADTACQAGAVCVRDQCRPRRAAGEACEQDIECGPGLFCHLERRVCEAQRSAGAPCADDRGIRDCAEDLFCAQRVCTEPVMRGPGNPCVEEGSVCTAGSWCDGQTCQAWLDAGSDCAEDAACGPEGACIDLVCAPRGGAGAACDRDRSCWPRLTCLSGACAALERCE